jgi:hypothetical protein
VALETQAVLDLLVVLVEQQILLTLELLMEGVEVAQVLGLLEMLLEQQIRGLLEI